MNPSSTTDTDQTRNLNFTHSSTHAFVVEKKQQTYVQAGHAFETLQGSGKVNAERDTFPTA